MKQLHVTEGSFALPLDFATEATGILARRGAGKSNAAVVIAEELHANRIPFVAVDPKGDWWGIRSNADGTDKGLPIVVFGGKHGDVPLEAGAGALIADLVLGDDERGYLSCVLDVSQFTLGEQRRFLTEFGERLYRRKDEERVLHLMLEEAHEYLPQQVRSGDAKLVSVWQRIVKAGRFKGLGCTLISQRSAALNKDVLTQVGALILMRVMSPQDKAAIKGWLTDHDALTVLDAVPSLPAGEAFILAPELLDGVTRFRFRRRWTFDSGATPKVGHKRVVPRTLADVDLGAVKEAMAETIEKAKASDPKQLRAALAKSEAELGKSKEALGVALAQLEVTHQALGERDRQLEEALAVERVEVPTVTDADRELAKSLQSQLGEHLTKVEELWAKATEIADRAVDLGVSGEVAAKVMAYSGQPLPDRGPRPLGFHEVTFEPSGRAAPHTGIVSATPGVRERTKAIMAAEDIPAGIDPELKLARAERAILSAIVSRPGSTPVIVGFLAQYSPRTSTFRNALGRLRSLGLIEAGQPLRPTAGGMVESMSEVLPTGPALKEFWLGRLSRAERTLLETIISAHPHELSRDDLSANSGYSSATSTFRNALGKLRSMELITKRGLALTEDFLIATGAD